MSELLKDPNLFQEYRSDIETKLKIAVSNHESIALYGYNQLKQCVQNFNEDMSCDNYENTEVTKDIAKAYIKLAHFIRIQEKDDLQKQFISFVLRAMKMNSLEAIQLFPCVLMLSKLGRECKDIFIEEVHFFQMVNVLIICL